MTDPRLLIPLRVPELGPSLGKLITGTGRAPYGVPLDAARIRLVSRIIDATGEARRLASRDERDAAVLAVGRSVWLESWEEAVADVVDTFAEHVQERILGEASVVRMPRRVRRRLAFADRDRRTLVARLGSAGAGLVAALDRMNARGLHAVDATALERDVMESWQEALLTVASRLEASWIALEEGLEAEARHWDQVTGAIGRWRKPLWPVFLVGGFALVVAAWLGLVLGGYLRSPVWFAALWEGVGL